MAIPREPRQKMINMMYLVLTALLALNVSAEIINAFKTVDNSLTKASDVMNASTNTIFQSFEEKLKDPTSREKALIWYPKAQQAQQLSDKVYNYIQNLKVRLMTEAGADFAEGDSSFKEDNLEAATRLMENEGEGEKLKNMLAQYKKDMLAIDPEINKEFENSIPIDVSMPKTQNKGNNTWTAAYFRMTPAIAGLTILSKFQNDVKNAENKVVNFAHSKVGAVVVTYDTYEPIIGTNSNYLMPGQELVVTAGIGAYNKEARPTVTVGGTVAQPDADGIATFKTAVSGVGSHSLPVKVEFTDQEGNRKVKTIDVPYTVGSPTGAFVSAEKVKVLYIDLPNELAVSGGNVGDEKVQVSIDNGTLRKEGPGKYISSPAKPGVAHVRVTADGKTSVFEFRVKTVPDPVAMVGRSKGGRIPSNEFKAQQGVRAELENFVFEGVNFTVTSYTLYCTGKGFTDAPGVQQVGSNTFDAVRNLINRCGPGSTVVLDEIKARGPGGTRTLPPIVFNLF